MSRVIKKLVGGFVIYFVVLFLSCYRFYVDGVNFQELGYLFFAGWFIGALTMLFCCWVFDVLSDFRKREN